MSIALQTKLMSREDFFDWAEAQNDPYEFDGFQPVAMTGGTARHSVVQGNIAFELRSRLRGPCRPLGPDAGVRTIGNAVRYPDAFVTCTKFADADREIPGAIVVFEVVSPTSGHTDRIVKLREYRAVPSIRRYVIVEHASAALTLHARAGGDHDWTATALTAADILPLPEIGIELPVAAFFTGTDLAAAAEA
jgi:Uma2 family endonuclease